MFFRCSSKEMRNFKIGYLILKGLILKSLKKWFTNVIQKVIHKRCPKSDLQTLPKKWFTNVTQK